MHSILRKQAASLRKRGFSYNLIAQKIPVSKSTLSYWLSSLPYKPNRLVKKRIAQRLLQFVMSRRDIKIKTEQAMAKEAEALFPTLSERDLHMFGLGLYLGEGSKALSNLRIANSDPRFIKIAVVWFERVFKVPRENFAIRLHLYPDCHVQRATNFWIRTTGLPKKQFYKPYIDVRKNKSMRKHRKLPYGTAHLTVKSLGNPIFGTNLLRKILYSIDAILKKFAI